MPHIHLRSSAYIESIGLNLQASVVIAQEAGGSKHLPHNGVVTEAILTG